MLAGAVGLTAAVVLMRQTQESAPRDLDAAPPPTIAIAQTTVARFAEAGIVLPESGDGPDAVGELQATPGDRTLRLSWARSADGDVPRGASGYDVRWGRPGALDNAMLVAATEVELRGLTNGERYDVEVRSVDAYGKRSAPTGGSGTPEPTGDDPLRPLLTGLYDDFRGDNAPDPASWAVQRAGSNCLRAGPGTAQEDDRLVLDLRCGNSEAVLRARAPMRLDAGPTLGRVVVVTDGPVPRGEISITLAPGPVTALGVAAGANPPATEPGRAVEDAALPPGTIRAVVTANGARIVTGAGVRRTGAPAAGELASVLGAPGVTARWELELTTTGVLLRRDGELAADADVVPDWRETTVMVGFTASPGDSARLHVDAIGFTGERTEPPTVVDTAGALAGETVRPMPGDQQPGGADPRRRVIDAAPTAESARLQVLAGPTASCAEGELVADFNGPVVKLGAAVPGGLPPKGPYCPYVAQLSPELVGLLRDGVLTTPVIRSASRTGVSVTGVLSVTHPRGTPVERGPAAEPPGPPPTNERHRLAHLSAELRDAAGEELVAGEPVAKGRVVLDIELDGLAGQRETGQLGGIAGIEVRLDNKLVAGLPTVEDGAAAAGAYRFGLSVAELDAGSHVVEVRVFGVQAGARPRSLLLGFQVDG